MTPLEHIIKQEIAGSGPMSVERYMTLCLSDPDHGYYIKQDPFGRAGDFITAPETSQMFGELIGVWCVDLVQRSHALSALNLIELGPGRGTLLCDLVRAGRTSSPAFADAIHLVEQSPALRRVQRETLKDAGLDARWHKGLDSIPRGAFIAIANEFFDALPIRQYQQTASGWRQRAIGLDSNGVLAFTTGDEPVSESAIPPGLRDQPQGAIVECCPGAQAIVAQLADRMRSHPGIALIIDYGPRRSGAGDTLQAVARHARTPVLQAPGDADLTAHVDFSALAALARQKGAAVYGPCTQRAFLLALGLEARASRLARSAGRTQARLITAAVERLAGVRAMGHLFKVMMIASKSMPVPEPFHSARP